MNVIARRDLRVPAALVLFIALTSTNAYPQPLSLRIPNEAVPPGGVIQVKLEVTEPKPISTGGGHLFLPSFEELLGVGVHSINGDAAAAIVWRPERPAIRVVSPTATLGLDSEYPLLTLTMRVPANATIGSRQPLRFDGGVEFLDPAGIPYTSEFQDGEAVVAETPAIANVTPGSATLPAGSIVTIEGAGFTPDLDVRFEETALARVTVLSDSLIQVVLAQPADMHGMGIQLRRRSPEFRSTYYSYQRTTRVGTSRHPLFAAIEPAFPRRASTATSIEFAATAADQAAGIALQNVSSAPATALLELNLAGGSRRASITLPPTTRTVRTLEELFGVGCGGARCAARFSARTPMHIMGIMADLRQQTATPVLPVQSIDGPLGLATAVNASSYRIGDLLTLQATYSGDAGARLADAYIVLQTPPGALLSLTPSGLVPGLTPYRRNHGVTPLTEEVLRVPVPTGAAVGAYQWFSALTAPGSRDLLTPVASTAFTIVP